MPPSTSMPSTSPSRGAGGSSNKPAGHGHADGGTRETVESIVMAIVLALLFRGFVAEAFVIPTGSMAPTLRGEHKDLWCPQCNFRYQAGTSREKVAGTVCPMCFYGHRSDVAKNPNEDSVSGDRIIVNKFVYDWSEPQRWDVIVFKYPGDASQNYIKRLIGLPGETIRIQGGNVWVKKEGEADFTIARKPAHRLESLLQLVHDTDYNSSSLVSAGALSRWYEEDVTDAKPAQWEANEKGTEFTLEGKGSGTHWLRYRHLPPTSEEWQAAENNDAKGVERLNSDMGELITDFYAYNATAFGGPGSVLDKDFAEAYCHGSFWVDDLAVETTAQVKSASGTIVLDVLRGGTHHVCKIDVATGMATITRMAPDGKALEFSSEDGSKKVAEIKGQTAIRGAGTYRIRLSNVDHETLLWVNGSVVPMDGPTTYAAAPTIAPFTSEEEPGDLQPARIGGEGVSMVLKKLRIYRDKYYIAQKSVRSPESSVSTRMDEASWGNDLLKPEQWNAESYLRSRIAVDFELGKDEFFPLGDNSPYSQDARTWPESGLNRTTPPNLVRRDLLIGKAMIVYWPHTWNRPVKFWPNLGQIRRIR